MGKILKHFDPSSWLNAGLDFLQKQIILCWTWVMPEPKATHSLYSYNIILPVWKLLIFVSSSFYGFLNIILIISFSLLNQWKPKWWKWWIRCFGLALHFIILSPLLNAWFDLWCLQYENPRFRMSRKMQIGCVFLHYALRPWRGMG